MEINYYFDAADPLKPHTCVRPSTNAGTLAPVDATRLEPEFIDGYWPCWDGESWRQVEDHRGQTVYDKETGAEVEIKAVGPLPDNLTEIPRPGPAYRWSDGQWAYDPALDSPGPDYRLIGGVWTKVIFSKKDFLLKCGLNQVARLNLAIAGGNPLAKTVHDLMFASEYIDLTDPATAQMLTILTTGEAEKVLTAAEVSQILTGVPHVPQT